MRVLVVDDSALIRMKLRDLLSKSGFEVFTASNGKEAVEKVEKLKPDVVTMDINMPVMDGLEALRIIMEKNPLPVIVLSTLTHESAKETVEALRIGAADFILKPREGLDEIAEELISKVRAAATSNPRILKIQAIRRLKKDVVRKNWKKKNGGVCVIIGSSTGGPSALEQVVPRLPADIPAPILIVQHMPPNFTKALAERLDSISELRVKEAEDNELLREGVAYVAPGGLHMKLRKALNVVRIKLFDDKPVNNVKPSVDVTAFSVAEIFGKKTVGVILTGMGEDGARGMKKIHDLGGKVIACNEDTCVVFGMPKAAIELNAVDSIKPLFDIPAEIANFVEVLSCE